MYTKHKKEFIKLTIRIDKEELDKFKMVCCIKGLSANNQINILIREFLFENLRFYEKSFSIPEIDNWDKTE